MLIIVDASFREGKREILEGYPLEAMPKVEHLSLEGEGELLVQLIRMKRSPWRSFRMERCTSMT